MGGRNFTVPNKKIVAARPRSRITVAPKVGNRCKCGRTPAKKSGRRERNFWMRRQAPKIATQTRERSQRQEPGLSGLKSPLKRPIWRRIGNARFAETGWWCAQSFANPSPHPNRCFSIRTAKSRGRSTDSSDERRRWHRGFELPPHRVQAQITGNLPALIREFEGVKQGPRQKTA